MGNASKLQAVTHRETCYSCSRGPTLWYELRDISDFTLPPDAINVHVVALPGAFDPAFDETDTSSNRSTHPRPRGDSLPTEHSQCELTGSPFRRHTDPNPNRRVVTDEERKRGIMALFNNHTVHGLEIQAPREFFQAVQHLEELFTAEHIHSLTLILNSRDAAMVASGNVPLAVVFPRTTTLVLNLFTDASQSTGLVLSKVLRIFVKIVELRLALRNSLVELAIPSETYAPASPAQARTVEHKDPSFSLLSALHSAKPIVLVTLSTHSRIFHVQIESPDGWFHTHEGGKAIRQLLRTGITYVDFLSIELDTPCSSFLASASLLSHLRHCVSGGNFRGLASIDFRWSADEIQCTPDDIRPFLVRPAGQQMWFVRYS